jgi:phosphatidate cytidylyltransferase
MAPDDPRPEDEAPPPGAGRVRIIGAEPAGGTAPAENPAPTADPPDEPNRAEPYSEDDPFGVSLPHWTEAPTGEVPPVLSRPGEDEGAEDDPWASLPKPAWREEHGDWEAHEDSYEHRMLASETPLTPDRLDEDRQPWTFDLDAEPTRSAEPAGGLLDEADDDATVAVPIVRPVTDPAEDAPVAVADLDDGVEALEGDDPSVAGEGGLQPPSRGRPGRRRPVPKAPPPPVAGTPGRLSRPVPPAPPPAPEPRPSRTRRRAPASSGGDEAHEGGRNLRTAVLVGLAFLVLAIILIELAPVLGLLLVIVVMAVASGEAYSAFRRAGQRPATLIGLVAAVSLLIASYNHGLAALPLVTTLVVVATFIWYLAGVERRADPVQGLGATLFVYSWVGVLGSYAALLLAPSIFHRPVGSRLLLGAVLATVCCDVGALAVGRWRGNHPMAPSISPNKTWEGFFGGAVASVLGSVIIVHLAFHSTWTVGKAAVLGLVVAVAAPLGDLCESLVKRHLGLKDMSSFLPGHGGFLDRVDGLLFVLPCTYYLAKAFHLG